MLSITLPEEASPGQTQMAKGGKSQNTSYPPGYSHLYTKLVEEDEPGEIPYADSKVYGSKLRGKAVMLDNPEAKKRQRGIKKASPGNLGLLRANCELRHSSLTYDQVKCMHGLWEGYIKSLLAGKVESQWPAALLKADYHGALIRVEASRTKSLVGKQGLVLQETHNAFIVIQVTDDQIKILPKRGTIFLIDLPTANSIRLFGDQLLVYSSHRATRKFKPKPNVFSL